MIRLWQLRSRLQPPSTEDLLPAPPAISLRLLPSRSRDLARVLALEMLGEPGPDGEIVALFCRWQVGKLAVPGGLRLSPQRHEKRTEKS